MSALLGSRTSCRTDNKIGGRNDESCDDNAASPRIRMSNAASMQLLQNQNRLALLRAINNC